jgi:hypothetical protein
VDGIDGAEPVYEVVSPIPAQRPDGPAVSDPLGDLTGRTVAFIWDSLFDGDLCFEAISAELSERYEGMTFVGYSHFGDIHGRDEKAVVEALPDRLQEYRVDAAIVGVGA